MKNAIYLLLGICMAAMAGELYGQQIVDPLPLAEQNRLVRQAQGKLDAWQGQTQLLSEAGELLQLVLNSNPNNVQARIEMARFIMKSGYVSYRTFRPGTLEAALQQLNLAANTDPAFADIYVLMGNVYFYQKLPTIALNMLAKAEAIGTNSVWLDLNYADAYMAIEEWDKAAARLAKWKARNVASKETSRAALTDYYTKLIVLNSHTANKQAVGDAYRSILALDPKSAWNHGNYADFLLLGRDDPDAAIIEADRALAIAEYGMARLTLGKAQYCKWAQLQKTNPKSADVYLSHAQQNAPNISMLFARMGAAADAGPNMQRLLIALQATGISIDTADEDGDTAFTIAASGGRLESAKWLLDHGAYLNTKRKDGWNALGLATWGGHSKMVRLLIGRGANVNEVVYQSRTPIHFAVSNKDSEMVKALIDLKADVNFRAPGSETPLMVAAQTGDTAVVNMLLAGGADPRIRAIGGKTAADIAESKGYWKTGDVIRARLSK
jgi:tetratricopeptide (TPR) repeat protein